MSGTGTNNNSVAPSRSVAREHLYRLAPMHRGTVDALLLAGLQRRNVGDNTGVNLLVEDDVYEGPEKQRAEMVRLKAQVDELVRCRDGEARA